MQTGRQFYTSCHYMSTCKLVPYLPVPNAFLFLRPLSCSLPWFEKVNETAYTVGLKSATCFLSHFGVVLLGSREAQDVFLFLFASLCTARTNDLAPRTKRDNSAYHLFVLCCCMLLCMAQLAMHYFSLWVWLLQGIMLFSFSAMFDNVVWASAVAVFLNYVRV